MQTHNDLALLHLEALFSILYQNFEIDFSDFDNQIVRSFIFADMKEKGFDDYGMYLKEFEHNHQLLESFYQQLLIHLMPNALRVDRACNIKYVYGNITPFSALEAGAIVPNISHLIREELREDIASLVQDITDKKSRMIRYHRSFCYDAIEYKLMIMACPFLPTKESDIFIAFHLDDTCSHSQEDITATLQKNIEHFHCFHNLVFDTIPDYIFVKDRQSNIVEANAAFRKVYPNCDIIGHQVIDQHIESEAKDFLEQDRKAFEEGYSQVYETITFPDGVTRTLHTTKVAFERDNQTYILGVARDMSEYLATKEELKSLAYKNDAFIASSGDGYWDWDLETNYQYMSPRFWEMFGYKSEEKDHHPSAWQDVIFLDDLEIVQGNLEKHIQTKGEHPFEQEVRYWHKNGSIVTVLCKGRVVEWGEDGMAKRMIGAHIDVTELKKIQQSLISANEELSQFAYRTSHDLRAPLKSALGIIDLIKVAFEKENFKKAQDLVSVAQTTLCKLDQLVSDILLMVRAEKEDKHKTQIDMSHIIDDSTQMLESLHKDKNINIIKDISTPHIWSYHFQLQSILENLLSNALKYSDPNQDNPYVKISVREDEHNFYLSVRDNGLGIDPKYHDKLFTLFSRFHNRSSYGSGIGLYMIKKIAKALRGDIAYIPHLEGSEFKLSLPKDQDAA